MDCQYNTKHDLLIRQTGQYILENQRRHSPNLVELNKVQLYPTYNLPTTSLSG
jgi:hypothetical protein